MTALLTGNLPLMAGAPSGIKKLRELILELAVRGKLVPQDPNDEPASKLLKRIAEEKLRLVAEGEIKRLKPLAKIGEEAEPFELPAGWKWSSLAQVAFVNPRNAAADSLQVSFVPMTFIGTRFDDQHGQEPRLWGELKQGFTHFAEGDIGVAKITPCFENSKACVFSNLVNGLGAGTTELHIVRPITRTLDPRYVLAYLKSPQFLLVGETKMTGTAGQKRLPKDFVEANPFPLPPLAEQHRIVAKVDELMALCDRLEARQADADNAHKQLVQALLASLTQASDAADFAANWQRLAEHFHTLFTTEPSIDALKQTLLQLAVMGKLVPQDHSEEPASALLKRIAEEKARLVAEEKIKKAKAVDDAVAEISYPIPSTWAAASLGQVVEIVRGITFPASEKSKVPEHGRVACLRTANVQNEIEWDDLLYIRENFISRPDQYVQPHDIVMSMANSRELVGKVALIGSSLDQPTTFGGFLGVLRPVLIEPRFVMALLRTPHARSLLIDSASQTTNIANVSLAKLRPLPFAIPPLAEQHRIVAKVDELMALCDHLKSRLIQARQFSEQLASTMIKQVSA